MVDIGAKRRSTRELSLRLIEQGSRTAIKCNLETDLLGKAAGTKELSMFLVTTYLALPDRWFHSANSFNVNAWHCSRGRHGLQHCWMEE